MSRPPPTPPSLTPTWNANQDQVQQHSQRLPVNPRRHRVAPEQRKRVATACNSCNVRRIKCSGERPCRQCANAGRECQYPVAIEKVLVSRNELEELRSRCRALEGALQEVIPSDGQRQMLVANMLRASPVESAGTGSQVPPPSEEGDHPSPGALILHDRGGGAGARYQGETSGATFVDNLKGFMATIDALVSPGTITKVTDVGTAGFISFPHRQRTPKPPTSTTTTPTALPSLDPTRLPHAQEITQRLNCVEYFFQTGTSGGVAYYGDFTYSPAPQMSSPPPPRKTRFEGAAERRIAFYQAAIAYSTIIGIPGFDSKLEPQVGATAFANARVILGTTLDSTAYTPADIGTLCLMSVYAIERNHRDDAYMYVAMAILIGVAHGLHRGRDRVAESIKRTFWTAYCMERWMALVLGRPLVIMDSAMNLELPIDAPGLPPCHGLRAHVDLARIGGYVLCNTYNIAPWSDVPAPVTERIATALSLTSHWAADLPAALTMSQDVFVRDRPSCVLHMAYNQVIILCVRPIFFTAVKKAIAEQFISGQHNIEDHPQIDCLRECSDAARRNLRIGRWFPQSTPNQKLLLADLNGIFHAAIILLLHQAVFINLRTNDLQDIQFTIDAFKRRKDNGDLFSSQCARILEELSALVQSLRSLMFDTAAAGGDAAYTQDEPQLGRSRQALSTADIRAQFRGSDAHLQQLMAWLEDDGFHMYNFYAS